MAMWWAKTALLDRPTTALSGAELERFKLEENITRMEASGLTGPIMKVSAGVWEAANTSRIR